MKNYTIKTTNETITVQFKNIKVIVHNITSDVKKQVTYYESKFSNFKDIYIELL